MSSLQYDQEDSKRKTRYLIGGTLVVAVFIIVLWMGTGGSASVFKSISESLTGTPTTLTSSCTCPTTPGVLSTGNIGYVEPMGQEQHEGNSPYFVTDCESDAKALMMYLQDPYALAIAQSMTRQDLGGVPPKQLFFSWDDKDKKCNFHLACPQLSDCGDTRYATGIVKM